MRTWLISLIGGLAILLGSSGSLHASILINGGFDSEPNFGAGTAGNDPGYSAFTGSQIPGWTIEPGHAVTIHNTLFYPTITPPYSANLDGEGYNGVNANLYQDFTSAAAQSYALSYDYQGWFFSTTTFTVTVVDLTTSSVLYSKTSAWTPVLTSEGGTFLGTGNTLRLRIAELTTGFNDNAFIVDNFSVTATTPEPTMLMIAATSGVLILWQWKRIARLAS